jgi:ABC-type uncharacterized transport system permease subunit
MLNSVVEIYAGLVTGTELIQVLLLQVIWIVVLIGLGQLALRTAVRRLVILGG